MNNDTERAELDETSKFHTVLPLRDLESNWAVDLAKNLEEYLLKIFSSQITSANHDVPHLFVNFAEVCSCIVASGFGASVQQKGGIFVFIGFAWFGVCLPKESLCFRLEYLRPNLTEDVSLAFKRGIMRWQLSAHISLYFGSATLKSSQKQVTSSSGQSEEGVSHSPHDEENDSFWSLDVPAEVKKAC